MKNYLSNSWNSFSSNFANAPFEIKIFLVFCILVTVFGYFIRHLVPVTLIENIIPITGGGITVPYSFNFIILGSFLANPRKASERMNIQFWSIIMLASAIVFGLIDLVTYEGGYEDNPYLYQSPWRPLWTIVVPILWILVWLSPRIKKYLLQFHRSEAAI